MSETLSASFVESSRLLFHRYVPNCDIDALLAEDAATKAAAARAKAADVQKRGWTGSVSDVTPSFVNCARQPVRAKRIEAVSFFAMKQRWNVKIVSFRSCVLVGIVTQALSLSVKTGMAASAPYRPGITLGKLDDPNPGVQGTDVSGGFTTNLLRQFLEHLNSPGFHEELTNYNCGLPVPRFQFSVTLRDGQYGHESNTLSVNWNYTPNFECFGTNRGLHAGLFYSAEKALARIDPGPHRFVLYRPILDCSKRGVVELWVKDSKEPEMFVAGRSAPPEVESEADKLPLLDLPPLPPPGAKARLVAREKSLGRLPVEAIPDTLTVDEKFHHFAVVVKRGSKQAVIVDGVEGKIYDGIPGKSEMTFSPDGNRFAFVARSGRQMLVVVDGKEGKLYDWIYDLFNPVFSPDSQHVAYVAGSRALAFPPMKEFVVMDGKELKHYATAATPVFSPDSQRFAYSAEKQWNRGMCVIADGKEQKAYPQIVGNVFSPNSKRLAYQAMTRRDRNAKRPIWDFAVIDGREELQYDNAVPPVFSPDSKHYAYRAVEMASNKPTIVLDGRPMRCGNALPDHSPVFSPDSRHLACLAHKMRIWMILMDGQVLDKDVGEFTHGLTFSPDSRFLAYVSHEGPNDFTVVVNGRPLQTYESVRAGPRFSPDGKRLAYIVSRAGKFVPAYGEFEGAAYDQFVECDSSRSTRAVRDSWRSSFAFDERGVFHAMTLRNGEILQLELEVVQE